jgi:hypothetical protein
MSDRTPQPETVRVSKADVEQMIGIATEYAAFKIARSAEVGRRHKRNRDMATMYELAESHLQALYLKQRLRAALEPGEDDGDGK